MPRVKKIPTTEAEKIAEAVRQLTAYYTSENSRPRQFGWKSQQWFKAGVQWIVNSADLPFEVLASEVYWRIADYLLRPIAEGNREVLSSDAVVKILKLPRGKWCLRALVLADLVYHLQHSDDAKMILLINKIIPVTQSHIKSVALALNGCLWGRSQKGVNNHVKLEAELSKVALQTYNCNVDLVRRAVFALNDRHLGDGVVENARDFYTPQRIGDIEKCAAKVVSAEEIVVARSAARAAVAKKLSDIVSEGARIAAARAAAVAALARPMIVATPTGTYATPEWPQAGGGGGGGAARVVVASGPRAMVGLADCQVEAAFEVINMYGAIINRNKPFNPCQEEGFYRDTACFAVDRELPFSEYAAQVHTAAYQYLQRPVGTAAGDRRVLSVSACSSILNLYRKGGLFRLLIIDDMRQHLQQHASSHSWKMLNVLVAILNTDFAGRKQEHPMIAFLKGNWRISKEQKEKATELGIDARSCYSTSKALLVQSMRDLCETAQSDDQLAMARTIHRFLQPPVVVVPKTVVPKRPRPAAAAGSGSPGREPLTRREMRPNDTTLADSQRVANAKSRHNGRSRSRLGAAQSVVRESGSHNAVELLMLLGQSQGR